VKNEILKFQKDGIPEKSFERAQKLLYGRAIMSYNDIDNIANGLIGSHFQGYGLFDDMEIFKTITAEDITARLRAQIDVENYALSEILPPESN
jgi:predicted Zn-dependent peptidase